ATTGRRRQRIHAEIPDERDVMLAVRRDPLELLGRENAVVELELEETAVVAAQRVDRAPDLRHARELPNRPLGRLQVDALLGHPGTGELERALGLRQCDDALLVALRQLHDVAELCADADLRATPPALRLADQVRQARALPDDPA